MPTKVDLDCCIACGTCITECPDNVYDEGDDGKPINARDENCTDCGICVNECPEGCIELI